MVVVGWDIVAAFVKRELASGAASARSLEARAASFRKAVAAAAWANPAEIRAMFGRADFVGKMVVFDLCGNNYRLVAKVNYGAKIVEIRFVGTHKEYDAIDVRSV